MPILHVLKSTTNSVPDIELKEDENVMIGRNKRTRITDVRCPKESVKVRVEKSDADGLVLVATDVKSKLDTIYKDGDNLTGPGYSYNVSISNPDEPKKKKLKTEATAATTWEFDEKAEVHVLKYLGGGKPSDKIASFDYDGTLSNPKSGAKFAKDGKDFKILDPKIPGLIKDYSKKGYRLVIFTNQGGIKQKRAKLGDVQKRIEGLLEVIGDVPCLALVSLEANLYRKPRPGMFELYENNYNGGVKVNRSLSFYCGDAAGRKLGKVKDHSAADLLFAMNLGIPFLTPEQLIANKPLKQIEEMDMKEFTLPAFIPNKLKKLEKTAFGHDLIADQVLVDRRSFEDKLNAINKAHKTVVVVMVGLPGSGKSTFYNDIFKGMNYVKVSRDELKTMEKCEKSLKEHLTESKKNPVRVVVDNTNVDIASRKRWLNISNTFGATTIAVYIGSETDIALHNNLFRRCVATEGSKVAMVPTFVIKKQAKELVIPSKAEGFTSVFKANFVPKFSRKEDEQLYYMFLSDK